MDPQHKELLLLIAKQKPEWEAYHKIQQPIAQPKNLPSNKLAAPIFIPVAPRPLPTIKFTWTEHLNTKAFNDFEFQNDCRLSIKCFGCHFTTVEMHPLKLSYKEFVTWLEADLELGTFYLEDHKQHLAITELILSYFVNSAEGKLVTKFFEGVDGEQIVGQEWESGEHQYRREFVSIREEKWAAIQRLIGVMDPIQMTIQFGVKLAEEA